MIVAKGFQLLLFAPKVFCWFFVLSNLLSFTALLTVKIVGDVKSWCCYCSSHSYPYSSFSSVRTKDFYGVVVAIRNSVGDKR